MIDRIIISYPISVGTVDPIRGDCDLTSSIVSLGAGVAVGTVDPIRGDCDFIVQEFLDSVSFV